MLVISQEQLIVGNRRHGQAYLAEVEEILQPHGSSQIDPMVDVVGQQKRGIQVVYLASLPRVRAVVELREPARGSQVVEDPEVGLQVEVVILVRRVVQDVPPRWGAILRGEVPLDWRFALRLVVDSIEAAHDVQELVQLGVLLWMQSGLEKRYEDVVKYVLETAYLLMLLIDGVQSRDLDHPPVVIADQLMSSHPLRKHAPLVTFATVNAKAPFCVLVFALFQIGH
mmetsp:Transcript_82742/g.224203  ORF Transcript_82742/g.224203 Transcript_82742/m.224203 type:complete len:226 (+) Transcript_82742:1333-2010(+)